MPESPPKTLETILVVDDNHEILDMVVLVLKSANFRVLSAPNGAAALKLATESDEKIHMLLSDVDMPELSGPDLGQLLKKVRPDLRVMLMSGGADGNLLVLNYGWEFVQKPFIPTKLVEKVLNVLHSPDRSQVGGQHFNSSPDNLGKS